MKLHRFYSQKISEPSTILTGSEAHHLAHVLRLKPEDKAELFDGAGKTATAIIKKIDRDKISLRIENLQTQPERTTNRIIIAASIAKGQRFDLLIEKCTELGADRICPVIFDRTVKQPENPKITQRWQNISISAVKQSRRLHLPKIDKPKPLHSTLKTLKSDYPNAQFLIGDLADKNPALIKHVKTLSDIVAFVGPEGGITENESNLLKLNKVTPVRLTQTILRIETAAIAVASVLTAMRQAHRQ